MIAIGIRKGKPFQATHRSITGLSTSPKALLQLVRQGCSLKSRHWIRDSQLGEDVHRFCGSSAVVMAALRTAALNLLRLAVFHSIREGLRTVMHNIKALLALAMSKPKPNPS